MYNPVYYLVRCRDMPMRIKKQKAQKLASSLLFLLADSCNENTLFIFYSYYISYNNFNIMYELYKNNYVQDRLHFFFFFVKCKMLHRIVLYGAIFVRSLSNHTLTIIVENVLCLTFFNLQNTNKLYSYDEV